MKLDYLINRQNELAEATFCRKLISFIFELKGRPNWASFFRWKCCDLVSFKTAWKEKYCDTLLIIQNSIATKFLGSELLAQDAIDRSDFRILLKSNISPMSWSMNLFFFWVSLDIHRSKKSFGICLIVFFSPPHTFCLGEQIFTECCLGGRE